MKKTFIIILTSLSITACSVSDDIDITYISRLPITSGTLKTSTLLELNTLKINQPTGLIKQDDRIIIAQQNGNFSALSFNLTTQKKQSLFARGRERGKVTYSRSLSPSSNSGLTVLDIYQGILFEAPDDNLTKSENTQNLPIQLPAGKQHLTAAKAGDLVIATGLYEQGRYLLFDPDDHQEHYYLDYPTHPAFLEIQEYTKSILYASTVLKVRPDNQAFVCGDMYSGLLDICRINNGKIERIKQHIFHYPRVYIQEKTEGYSEVAYSKDNPFGFTDISVSDDHIYAIYSGKTFRQDREHFQQCKTLLVLDWEGNILNTYNIDAPLSNVHYDATENAIYAISHNSQAALVKINL